MRRLVRSANLALALLAAVLAAGAGSPASGQTPPPIVRVGAAPYDAYAEAYYGAAMGFFQKAGLDVRIETFTSGEKIADAVAGGAIDIGLDNPIHLALTMAHGATFVLTGGGALYSSKVPTTALFVDRASQITTAKQLEGNVVAISGLKNIQELGVRAWLVKGGADVTKVRFIELPTAEMGPALNRGTVAAALMAEPFLSAALRTNSVRLLGNAFDSVAPQFYINTWFTTAGYLQKNPDVVKRFMAAAYETARWVNGHPDETGQVLIRVAKVDPDTLHSMRRALFADDLRSSGLQSQLDLGLKYGVLDRATTLNEMTGH